MVLLMLQSIVFGQSTNRTLEWPPRLNSATTTLEGHLGNGITGFASITLPCGTWQSQPIYYTDWQSIDTLCAMGVTNARNWVYSDFEYENLHFTDLVYRPCGGGNEDKWKQYRVCTLTGIRQMRYKVQSYKYIPPPKDPYTAAIDSLTKVTGYTNLQRLYGEDAAAKLRLAPLTQIYTGNFNGEIISVADFIKSTKKRK